MVRKAHEMRLASVLMVAALVGCGPSSDPSSDAQDSAFTGTPNNDIGQFFMVDHFGVTADGFADVHNAIRQKNLGAVILWNPTNASGETLRQMIERYAATAH